MRLFPASRTASDVLALAGAAARAVVYLEIDEPTLVSSRASLEPAPRVPLSKARRFVRAAALAALLLLLAILLRHHPAPVVDAGVRRAHPFRARGAIHVHTALSKDARGAVEQIARAAREEHLDFVVITDHGTDASLASEGYREGVLVLGGIEKSTDAGHALVLGTATLPFGLDGDPATVVDDVRSLGGFVVAAHPTSRRRESPWSAGVQGLAGVEIVNLAEPQAWPEPGLGSLWPLVSYAADAEGALLRNFRFNREAVSLWDEWLETRSVAGLVGSDAHGGFPVGRLFVPVPSHRRILGLASQHLVLREGLSRESALARRQVLEALRTGRGYVGFDALAPASGFFFEGETGGERAGMGESLALAGEATLRAAADAPPGTTLVLLRDGHEVARGERIHHSTREAGVYRVEAYLDPRWLPRGRVIPWILSNPIALFPAEELVARARRAEPPPADPPIPPSSMVHLDTFDEPRLRTSWQVDQAGNARGVVRLEGGALRFDYALGPGPTSHASFCDWTQRDLSAYRTLVFHIRSDRPLRFDLQVRTIDPSAPEGVRVWRRSVRATESGSWAVVPLASLKTYDLQAGHPDLRHVRGIYFHVDEANLPPGSRGTLSLDDIGFGS